MTEPRPVVIADGSRQRLGLKCAKCGETLVGVVETFSTNGFITRKRKCTNPKCGFLNITDERVVHAHEVRSYNRKLLSE